MESLSLEEVNIIKDIRSLFRLKKINYSAIKDISILFREEKKLKQLKIEYLEILRKLL